MHNSTLPNTISHSYKTSILFRFSKQLACSPANRSQRSYSFVIFTFSESQLKSHLVTGLLLIRIHKSPQAFNIESNGRFQRNQKSLLFMNKYYSIRSAHHKQKEKRSLLFMGLCISPFFHTQLSTNKNNHNRRTLSKIMKLLWKYFIGPFFYHSKCKGILFFIRFDHRNAPGQECLWRWRKMSDLKQQQWYPVDKKMATGPWKMMRSCLSRRIGIWRRWQTAFSSSTFRFSTDRLTKAKIYGFVDGSHTCFVFHLFIVHCLITIFDSYYLTGNQIYSIQVIFSYHQASEETKKKN